MLHAACSFCIQVSLIFIEEKLLLLLLLLACMRKEKHSCT